MASGLRGETRGSAVVQAIADYAALLETHSKANLSFIGRWRSGTSRVGNSAEHAAVKETVRKRIFGEHGKEYCDGLRRAQEVFAAYSLLDRQQHSRGQRLFQSCNFHTLKIAETMLNDLSSIMNTPPLDAVTQRTVT